MNIVGNRTVIVAVVSWIAAVAARYGFSVDPNAVADVLINGYPVLMVAMRMITRTPIGRSV